MRSLLLVPLLAASASTAPFELPAGEPRETWEAALAEVGLAPGAAGGHAPWVRLERAGPSCVLVVSPRPGVVEREPVPCPATSPEREDVAALAALLLEPMVAALVRPPPERIPSAASATNVPASTPAPAHTAPAPPHQAPSPDPTGAGPASGRAPTVANAAQPPSAALDVPPSDGHLPPPPATAALADNAAVRAPATPGAAPSGPGPWRVQAENCGCVADFEKPCFPAERCSTAVACPATWFLDWDRDGFGGQVPNCQPEHARSRAFESVHWVQNVGDCDDRDPNVRPGVVEIPSDGVDNDCDGNMW
jgi:hypothetical protein